jgi:putative membrane protein
MSEEIIAIRRKSKVSLLFWLKAILTLGIWWRFWYKNDYLALTRRSIVRRKGVFQKEERAVPLNQVQDISVSYGIIRRLLGEGDIKIETAAGSGTEIVMNNVGNPEGFRSLVFKQIDEFYGDEERPQGKRE